MSQQPQIQTAIPRHRYQVGNYSVTLLGDIASGDGIDYRYILAFVPTGQNRPSLYICCERNRPPDPPGRPGHQCNLIAASHGLSPLKPVT